MRPSRQDASPRSLGRAHAHRLLWRLQKPACRVSPETSSGKESRSRFYCSVLPGRPSVDRRDASSPGAEHGDVTLLSFPVFPRVELAIPSSLTIFGGGEAETSSEKQAGKQAAGQAPPHAQTQQPVTTTIVTKFLPLCRRRPQHPIFNTYNLLLQPSINNSSRPTRNTNVASEIFAADLTEGF